MKRVESGYVLDVQILPSRHPDRDRFCEATLSDRMGWPILRTYGGAPVAALVRMEDSLRELHLTIPLEFVRALIDGEITLVPAS